MENAIQIPEKFDLVNAEYTDDLFKAAVVTADYFPRLQLMGSNSDAVKEGLLPMGVYALIKSKDDMKELGAQIDVLICSWRLKAMQIKNDEVISIFDSKNPEFTRIKNEATVPDSGCLCGVEFLVFVPTAKEFATFYMASKSALRLAPKVRSYINEQKRKPGAATLNIELASNKKYKWHVSVIQDCTTPFDLPEQDIFLKAVTKFNNPPIDDREVVTNTTERAR